MYSPEEQVWQGVFHEDVIQSKDKKKIGIVIKTAKYGDNSDDDSSSDEDEHGKVEDGKIMVGWFNTYSKWNDDDEVNIIDENTIELVDRALTPGDIVRWVSPAKGKEKGFVRGAHVTLGARIVGTNYILDDISAKDVVSLDGGLSVGRPVLKGSKVGILQGISIELTVVLKNGSKCLIAHEAVNDVIDVTDQRDEDSNFYTNFFYPGQQIQGSARTFKDAKWLVGTKPAISNQGKIKAIVERVDLIGLNVNWQFMGYPGPEEDSPAMPSFGDFLPKDGFQSNDFNILMGHKESSFQIGDKCYYFLKEDDVERFTLQKSHKKKKEKPKEACSENENDNQEEEEDNNDSDYEMEPVASSVSSSRRSHTRQRNRRRHVYIQKIKKRYKPPVDMKTGEKVCVEICHVFTRTDIVWQDGRTTENIPSVDLYPVIHLDELEFFPGDFVIDKRVSGNPNKERFGVVQKADSEARVCSVRWIVLSNGTMESTDEVEADVSVYDVSDHKDYCYRTGDVVARLHDKEERTGKLAPAGIVEEVNSNGTIKVSWVDKSVSSVWPTQLYVVQQEDDYDDDEDDDDDEGNDGNTPSGEEWETTSDVSDSQENTSLFEDIIMRSLGTVVGLNQRTADYLSELAQRFTGADGDANTEETNETDESSHTCNNVPGATICCLSSLEHANTSHHFFYSIIEPTNPRTFNTAIMKDVKLLKTHLPPGIVVKRFDDRMDLLSVMVAGPDCTPYEDCLFFFDLQLPECYPTEPPNVHYYSFCTDRLNPNLYEEGKVCISLLGTWAGKGSERWTSRSTIHQLLLSIQGLILCQEPYYNEAGYEKHRGTGEGLENSRMYNEMAVVKTLQSTERIISKPPEVFQSEVQEHFRQKLPQIIKRFDSWLLDQSKPLFPLFPISRGFRATITRILERLRHCSEKPENVATL